MFDRRRVAVTAGILVMMCLGTAYSWGVFLNPIEQDTGWNRLQVSFAVSVLLLVFSVFMVAGGWCVRKIGAANTAALGGILVGLGWVLASRADSQFELYLSYGLLAGIGTGLSYMPAISTGIQCYPEKKGRVAGVITFGFGFGTAVLAPVLTRLLDVYGWRATMLFCGIVFGCVIVGMSRLLRVSGDGAASLQRSLPSREQGLSWRSMIKERSFWILVATYFLAMIAGMMLVGHLAAFVQDGGFSPMQGAVALTVLSVFNGLGRVFFGYLADKLGGRRTLVALFAIMGAAMILLAFTGTLGYIYALAGLAGLCFGGFLATYPSLTVDYFGRKDFAMNYGIVFIGYGSGCFLGPLIAAEVHDLTFSYVSAFVFAGGVAFAGGLLTALFLKKPQASSAS